MVSNLAVKKGTVLLYRIFDIAEEVSIPKVESILRDYRGPDRFKVPKFIDKAIIMKNPPVSFGLGEENLQLKTQKVKLDVLVKIRDFGVMTLIYQINIPTGMSLTELTGLATELEEGSEIDTLALQQTKEICSTIQSALKKPTNSNNFEDYLIFLIESFQNPIRPIELIKLPELTHLLLTENQVQVSDKIQSLVTENYFQYSDLDLTLIEWNSAFVLDPSGSRDIPDILEFAVTQLMEMRYYDELLENKLNFLYDDIEKKRSSIWNSRFDKVYEDASARYIEYSDFLEKVENSLKVVGDFYLATLYRAATKKFRLADWQQIITRKMNLLAQVSSLLQGEFNVRRSHWMEVTIILLIAYEIFLAFFKH